MRFARTEINASDQNFDTLRCCQCIPCGGCISNGCYIVTACLQGCHQRIAEGWIVVTTTLRAGIARAKIVRLQTLLARETDHQVRTAIMESWRAPRRRIAFLAPTPTRQDLDGL